MDKKVMYGLGAVALLGAIWYFKNKSQVAPEEVAEQEASPEEAGGGASGGGGASAPSPSDMAMGEVAKEELRKSMDLGGLDMASPKAEKGAVVTGMVASMVSKGKEVSPTLARAMVKAPLPTPAKDKIISTLAVRSDSNVAKAGAKSIFNQGRPTRDVAPKPTLGKTISTSIVKATPKPVAQVNKAISKAVAKTPQAQVYKAVNKAVVKATPQVSKAVNKATDKYVQANKKLLTNVYVKPAQKVISKFKKFDGEDMFENAVSSNKQCHYVNEITGYTSTGQPIVNRKLVCVSTSNTARFDGFADDMSNFSGASDF